MNIVEETRLKRLLQHVGNPLPSAIGAQIAITLGKPTLHPTWRPHCTWEGIAHSYLKLLYNKADFREKGKFSLKLFVEVMSMECNGTYYDLLRLAADLKEHRPPDESQSLSDEMEKIQKKMNASTNVTLNQVLTFLLFWVCVLNN
jgi:hypothetical protein